MNLSGSSKEEGGRFFLHSNIRQELKHHKIEQLNITTLKCYGAIIEKNSSRRESSPGRVACAAHAGIYSSIPA